MFYDNQYALIFPACRCGRRRSAARSTRTRGSAAPSSVVATFVHGSGRFGHGVCAWNRQRIGLGKRVGQRRDWFIWQVEIALWAALLKGCGSPSSSPQTLSGKRRTRSVTKSPGLRQLVAGEGAAIPGV
jgi:hypothetical protein